MRDGVGRPSLEHRPGKGVSPQSGSRVIVCDEREKLVALDIDALYRKYGPMVIRRCRVLLIDEEQALDAAQETFVKLLRYQHRLTDAAPSSMLYTMATNVCLNMMRSARRRPLDAGEETLERIASADNVEGRALDRLALEDIFGRERASTKTMAVMHYVDGMTIEEVASHVGLSVSGVRKRLRLLKERTRAREEA
jgi:RNA polymerase sigma-70 factor (ECF subfamily)